MKKIALALVVSLAVGCGSIRTEVLDQIKPKLNSDLTRTVELADKYGKPEVKKCADFLLAQLNAEDSAQARLDALLKEETDGLFSAALKAALIADLIRELQSPESRAKFEQLFKDNCNAVAGDLMIRALRAGRTAGSRGAL